MRNLHVLALDDLLAIVGGVLAGNAITLLFLVVLGVSDVPAGAGVIELLASFVLVLVGITVLPVAIVVLMTYLSFTMYG